MKKPDYIGPETIEKASRTISGRFAAAIDRLLYHGDYKTSESGMKQYITSASVTATGLPGATNHVIDTESLLREVRDHLEMLALREVIP